MRPGHRSDLDERDAIDTYLISDPAEREAIYQRNCEYLRREGRMRDLKRLIEVHDQEPGKD